MSEPHVQVVIADDAPRSQVAARDAELAAAFVHELADAPWAGPRGGPAPARATLRSRAQAGRVTIELVCGEGRVTAQGSAAVKLPTANQHPSKEWCK